LTTFTFSLVLFGAVLHAVWNTLIKLSPDKPLETALMNLTGSFLALPLLIIFGLPELSVWPFILASLLLHVIYYYSLANAYQWGDLSLTYPIMRGVAPLILLVMTIFLQADDFTSHQIIAICFIGFGLISLSMSPKKNKNISKAILFALLNACIIALYTIVDGFGVRGATSAFSYIILLLFLDGFLYSSIVFNHRSWPLQELKLYFNQRWPFFLCGAVATMSSYGIALWAMTVAPISVISALREISVLFAVLIAVLFLKEKVGKFRWLGILLISIGMFIIKFS
jgi:drug/metabolite transporter (DMT)-like permease